MTSGGTGYAGVLFDFSGTLFRLEPDPAWFAGLADAEGRILDDAAQRELLHRMTVPVGPPVPMEGEALRTWHARDLSSADHRDAYLHILEHSGIADAAERERLYGEFSNPLNWTIYPDTAAVLRAARDAGLTVGVLSNIGYDIRPAFEREGIADLVDQFVLSFEVGHAKPDLAVFHAATAALGLPPERVLMVGDSAEADGASRAIGCGFAQVEPLPVDARPAGLLDAVRAAGAI
ncbi:Pyrimidine 5'-nucleotidase YjjG (plasmid) [Tsukamurella tyrosinosolvens]|uniref:Haloacid dehalogenase superfamily, subfamily IA, variant 2 with 3rd motif like haloacid dehalogenase/haloacid dehalogenase superfamily, subfamily IA, variant 3 with third motif having DD or ED n=1 Tax=Tsukamurella tyrosinosolvens TaxID=57704 RepID=A0A1H4ZK78_TSUTY|nr:HAD family hydrolase [Tsukamurella tyrosinosolvens]KXO95602.1 haloacid dehalogenase [Tsukamurella tyrosinosolvens]SED30636.1 Haloacid dehalogenase superfamily, subfamily IA, variant 2 with 3rd motif like haloacid dehalogenase/haloacid dehalogenase superfamily, subfamily IA, variant 3 with third motif having DD or ED [Tsukamurella tyrosinosolvens]VEI01244.1 Pyrimidine 5'-nucleotidase YjjG [Tsukamurella tyrosinosolvens]